jgi:hypothetical protein
MTAAERVKPLPYLWLILWLVGNFQLVYLVEMALAHTLASSVERAYRRGRALEKRRALMAAWADYCGGKAAAASLSMEVADGTAHR